MCLGCGEGVRGWLGWVVGTLTPQCVRRLVAAIEPAAPGRLVCGRVQALLPSAAAITERTLLTPPLPPS